LILFLDSEYYNYDYVGFKTIQLRVIASKAGYLNMFQDYIYAFIIL
jgi:hypothetical protein